MGSVERMTEPYRAAMKKEWNAMKKFYDENKEYVTASLTVSGDTALHIAVHSGDAELVKSLLNEILFGGKDDPFLRELAPLRRKNEYGNTALHEAASGGHLEMVKLLLNCDEKLLEVKNNSGETPLFRAAAFGQTKVVRFLTLKVEDMGTHRRRDDSTSILHVAVLGKYFGNVNFFSFFVFGSLFTRIAICLKSVLCAFFFSTQKLRWNYYNMTYRRI